jgi:hypothetical protein
LMLYSCTSDLPEFRRYPKPAARQMSSRTRARGFVGKRKRRPVHYFEAH